MASPYSTSMNQSNVAGPASDRAMTEMETLTANLGEVYRRLNRVADSLQGRIDSFMQNPSALKGGPAEPTVPEPSPGTFGSLRHFVERMNVEATRIERAAENLAGIF